MTHPYEAWQVSELARLAETDPGRTERALNALWAAVPGLYEELARSAGVAASFEEAGFALVETSESAVARLAESRIAVWEVVRAHRRGGSLEELSAAFPTVDRDALEAALEYGRRNHEEIDRLIERYESKIEQRRAQYPYAR
ncbi:MAG TPA: DUF433 domain-containing protein [Fimbriimonadaceae bacterium]|nr:DUF433 domain-containing protein [Fimbriimonadaceae bacterium]